MSPEKLEPSEANETKKLSSEAKKLTKLSAKEKKALKSVRKFNELKDRIKDTNDLIKKDGGQFLMEAAIGEIYQAVFELDRKLNLGLSLKKKVNSDEWNLESVNADGDDITLNIFDKSEEKAYEIHIASDGSVQKIFKWAKRQNEITKN